MISKKHINIYKANRKNAHYYLEIFNNEYDIFRSFKTFQELINHLKKYPIQDIENIIKDLEVV